MRPVLATSTVLSRYLLTIFVLTLFCLVTPTASQVLVNGQTFSNGLVIISAPFPQSTFRGNIPIALDLSGNGKIPQSAFIPQSSNPTSYDFLEVYLVSYQTQTNLTVSAGPGLLSQEPGSTVKHLDYQIPACIQAGSYDMVLYEGSHIDGQAYYSITALPIDIENNNRDTNAGPCTGDNVNALLDQPQDVSPHPEGNPFVPQGAQGSTIVGGQIAQATGGATANKVGAGDADLAPDGSSSTAEAQTTPAPSLSRIITSLTGAPTADVVSPLVASQITGGIITITLSDGGQVWPLIPTPTPTVTENGATVTRVIGGPPTTVTVVFVSVQTDTVTQSASGEDVLSESTRRFESTTTIVMDATGIDDSSLFVPVNAGSLLRPSMVGTWLLIGLSIAMGLGA